MTAAIMRSPFPRFARLRRCFPPTLCRRSSKLSLRPRKKPSTIRCYARKQLPAAGGLSKRSHSTKHSRFSDATELFDNGFRKETDGREVDTGSGFRYYRRDNILNSDARAQIEGSVPYEHLLRDG